MSDKNKVSPEQVYFMGPRQIHTMIVSRLREQKAVELTDSLSRMVESYWAFYTNLHDKGVDQQVKAQAWYYFQAYRNILMDYGWWDNEHKLPVDWTMQTRERGFLD